jgi:GNAT superfamily N-acetyltransferase
VGSPELQICRLSSLPSDLLAPLIRESVAEKWEHLTRLRDEWISGVNRFSRRGEGLYLGALGGEAVVVCGLNIDPYAGDPQVARLRRLYVLPRLRRLRIGRTIVKHVLEDARLNFGEVRLRTDDTRAKAFYRALGFSAVSGIEHCTHTLSF